MINERKIKHCSTNLRKMILSYWRVNNGIGKHGTDKALAQTSQTVLDNTSPSKV